MKRTRKQTDPWEGYEFIDINSRSGEEPPRLRPMPRQTSSRRRETTRRTGRSAGSRPGSRPPRGEPIAQPSREPPGRGERVRRRSDPRGGIPPSERRRQARERPAPKKPLSKGARLFLLVFTLVCMVAITAFLCVFLLFKVRTIEVTGDVVYEQSAILEVCGYEVGDNLALLTTDDKEQALEEQLPYVEDAEILRHFPSGLEIHITAAQKTACISSGGQWFAVSGKGKILEVLSEPAEGIMQVTGVTLTDAKVGGQVQAQDEDYQEALETILTVLNEWNAAGDFVSLDVTDLYNITMNYQNRILFELGSTAGLDYKVDYGIRLVYEELDSNDTGTLDLSLANEVRRAYFTATNSSLESTFSASSSSDGDSGDDTSDSDTSSDDGSGDDSASTEDSGSADGTDQDTGGDTSDDTGEETSDDTVSQDRGGDIPDTIFTG